MTSLSDDLVAYRINIRQKIRDVRGAGQGRIGREAAIHDRRHQEGHGGAGRAERHAPLSRWLSRNDTVTGIVARSPGSARSSSPLGTAGFVVVLVLFMLLEREDLRDRLIGLIGHGHLATTTKAFDEAGRRVSRQLLLQTLVNAIYGALAAVGLWMFGVPYPLFWGALGAALRFIPYVGPLIASLGPFSSAWRRCPAGRSRSRWLASTSSSSSSPTWCSKPCSMPAPRASPRSRCWWLSRSGPGSGVRSAC